MNTPAGYTRVHTHTRTRMRSHTYITTIREHAQQPSSDTDQAPTHKTPSRSQTQPNRATPQSAAAERKVCLLRRRRSISKTHDARRDAHRAFRAAPRHRRADVCQPARANAPRAFLGHPPPLHMLLGVRHHTSYVTGPPRQRTCPKHASATMSAMASAAPPISQSAPGCACP